MTKPAAHSKTLKFNRWAAIATAAVMYAPTAVSFVVGFLGDPQIAAAVANMIPVQYRTLFVLLVTYMAHKNTKLRYQTTTAIEGHEEPEEHPDATAGA